MNDFTFGTLPESTIPRHNRGTVIATVLVHVVLLLFVIQLKARPVRVSSAGTASGGIAAYVAGPIGGAAAPQAKPEPKVPTIARAAKAAPKEDQSDGAQAVGTGGQAGPGGGGPVRLGSGGSLTLLNKVTPIYPAIMQSARVPGQVVLDAIIHHDGTIGDIKVLNSTNEAFAQAAIAAVKQWRYTPIPYEGIVTVTVNFTLPR